jgi:hypothetical protein
MFAAPTSLRPAFRPVGMFVLIAMLIHLLGIPAAPPALPAIESLPALLGGILWGTVAGAIREWRTCTLASK